MKVAEKKMVTLGVGGGKQGQIIDEQVKELPCAI